MVDLLAQHTTSIVSMTRTLEFAIEPAVQWRYHTYFRVAITMREINVRVRQNQLRIIQYVITQRDILFSAACLGSHFELFPRV